MTTITLKEFLYKFTAVPRKFIDEYYSFYELCQTDQFGIPLQKLIKYLGINNQERVETRLREDFELNIDYVIIRELQKLKKGVKAAKYMISFNTFKKLCMVSRTKKGEEYRDYYTMIDEFIDYYKEHINDKIMELTQTSKFMYILAVNKSKNIFKIGRTGDIRKRLQAYATGRDKHPDIELILIVKDDKQVEKCSKKIIPYKFNRVVVFDSRKIHESLLSRFKEGYENRKINYTFLYA